MNTLIIYHGGCYDGFTAAWIAQEAISWENTLCDLHPARYGDPPPDVRGRVVYVLDFSYPRAVMEQMAAEAGHLTVLDHHKTAAADCEGLAFCTFDMEHSGCGLTWRHFIPGEPPPWVQRIEDRDLWRFRYPDTADVHAYVASLPMTTESWDALSRTPFDEIVNGGKGIRRYIDTYLDKAAHETRRIEFCGYPVVALNIPYQNASEAADVMLKREPAAQFSMGYFQRGDGRWQFSLRSRGDFDVSEIAKRFGGGGHAGAAGFDLAELPEALR